MNASEHVGAVSAPRRGHSGEMNVFQMWDILTVACIQSYKTF